MPKTVNKLVNLFNSFEQNFLKKTGKKIFILSTHFGADFDDFSSLCAFLDYLDYLNSANLTEIETHICLSGSLEQDYLDLTPANSYFWKDENQAEFEKYFSEKQTKEEQIWMAVFGCSDKKRVSGNPYLSYIDNLNLSIETLNFDHHIHGENWANYNFTDDEASSNAENLLEILIRHPNYKPNPETATNLMIGLTSDTVNFFASSTTSLTHKHAGKLLNLGADIALVREIIHAKWTLLNLNRLQTLLKETTFLNLETVTWSKNQTRKAIAIVDCAKDSEIASLFSNEILDILKTWMVIMIKNDFKPNDRKLSIRCLPESEIKAVDLAMHFGGGGHKLAAGGNIGQITVENFKNQLIDFIKKPK